MTDIVERLEATGGKGQGGPLKKEAADEIRKLRAIIASAQSAWQPIETAPKDGLLDIWTVGWGSEPHRVTDCYYDHICREWRTSRPSGRLLCIKGHFVTHWMPRAAAPSTLPSAQCGAATPSVPAALARAQRPRE